MIGSGLCRFVAATLLLFPGLVGCASSRSAPPQDVSPVQAPSPTLAPSIFYEEGNLVFLGVNAHLARFHLDKELIPFEIAIANRGLHTLTVTPERITLRTAAGQRFPVAQPEESTGSSLRSSFDRKLMPVPFDEILELRFSTYQFVPLTTGLRGGNQTISRTVKMARNSWTMAQVWFPHPGEEMKGKVYEIWLEAPELTDPVFTTIRF
jgi:hypothetical protein